jgi:hypothetical protein
MFLIQKQTDTVGRLQYGRQLNSYRRNTFKFKQFFLQPSSNNALNPYYGDMKPFVLVMRAMGVLPVSSTAEGKHRHSVTVSISLGKC